MTYEYNNRLYPVMQKPTKGKNIRFRVTPNKEIIIMTRKTLPRKAVEMLLAEHHAWLDAALAEPVYLPVPGYALLAGEHYRLIFRPGPVEFLPERTLAAASTEQLAEFGREQVTRLFRELEPAFGRRGTELVFAEMKSRWGVCFLDKNRIKLNAKLYSLPRELQAYIICHEFTHFTVPNHSREFYAELAKVYPHYRAAIQKLKFYRTLIRQN